MNGEREYKFTRKNFEDIKSLVFKNTGISLSDDKEALVYGRLVRRLRVLNMDDFDAYCRLLRDENGEEFVDFTNAITTNLTSFFRESHHFDYLVNDVVSRVKEQTKPRLRIWSAGCSTGEEPYSIAMTLYENIPNINNWDVRILATDLDTNVIQHASDGVYNIDRIEDLSRAKKKKWFHKGKGKNADKVKVKQELKELITFKHLNLMKPWPMKNLFDVIFCRNVLIYFNKDTQKNLVERYADYLTDDGYLYLGHSESMNDVTTRFELLGKSSYKKCA